MNETQNIMDCVKAGVIKKMYKVSDTTLARWRNANTIKFITNPAGRFLYFVPSSKNGIPDNHLSDQERKICYCRVSSSKQKNDLQRQIQFMREKYPNHTIITDVGSGINWKRTGLQTILGQAMRGQLSEVVVSHRDRLCRFAFELIQWILEDNEVSLVVLDDTIQSSEQELADDLLSIIHVFSCRQMGKRRYQNKQNKRETESSGEIEKEFGGERKEIERDKNESTERDESESTERDENKSGRLKGKKAIQTENNPKTVTE